MLAGYFENSWFDRITNSLHYVAISIPNDFILGYGLDYDQQGRGLKDLYTLVTE